MVTTQAAFGLVAFSLHTLESLFASNGYWIIALLIAGESAGLPLPGETSLLAGAYVAEQGDLSIVLVIAVAAGAAIVGDNIGYLVGRHAGRGILERYGRLFRIRERQLRLMDYYFEEHGGKTVFFGRWVAILRVGAALFAGSSRMPWPRFFLWNALGGMAWAVVMGSVGYLFARSLGAIDKAFGVFGIVALVVTGVLLVVFVRRTERRLVERVDQRRDPHASEQDLPTGEKQTEDGGRGTPPAKREYPPAA